VGDDTKHILAHQVNNTLGKKKIIFSGSPDEHHGSGKSDYYTSWQRSVGNRKRNDSGTKILIGFMSKTV
jgi:hypothetical protein